MEKKRSKGVTAFGIITLLFVVLLVKYSVGLGIAIVTEHVPLPHILFYAVISAILLLISAIGILRLKNWARILILITFSFLILPFFLFYLIRDWNEGLMEIFKNLLEVLLYAPGAMLVNGWGLYDFEGFFIGRVILKAFGVLTLVYIISGVWFFTRPKVKEQFK